MEKWISGPIVRLLSNAAGPFARGNLAEIDAVGGVVGAGPNRSVPQDLLEGGLSFCEFLLREIAIADVTVGEEEELISGNVEGGFLGKRNHFGLVVLDDFRGARALSLELS
jgi:hypothetical protein